jgi:SAM-dependent methyltransferase
MNHREYVGGMFDEMTKWQFDYVTTRPEFAKNKNFLDIGCGSMRLGKVLIPHLNKTRYYGLDINEELVKLGVEKECDPMHIINKEPTFIITQNWDMSKTKNVHFAWAQAVFNHLNLDTIGECLKNLHGVMTDTGVLYFTYWPGTYNPATDDTYTDKKQNIYKTKDQITELFAQHGFTVEHDVDVTNRGQTICVARKHT